MQLEISSRARQEALDELGVTKNAFAHMLRQVYIEGLEPREKSLKTSECYVIVANMVMMWRHEFFEIDREQEVFCFIIDSFEKLQMDSWVLQDHVSPNIFVWWLREVESFATLLFPDLMQLEDV